MKVFEAKLVYSAKKQSSPILDSPEKIAGFMQPLIEEKEGQEQFWALAFNQKNRLIAPIMVALGTSNSCLVSNRDVFRALIIAGANAFAVVHNHPSGDPTPSNADIRVTRNIREAAGVMDVNFLDHVIIGDKDSDPSGQGYYSFQERGMI